MSFQRELDAAIRLCREAGQIILGYYDQPPDVDWKSEREPVTAADRDANNHIVAGLLAAFPEDAILAEESPDTAERLGNDRVWVIDPLDGTKEFIKHNGEFSVMIGLAEGGRAVAGVVYQPTAGKLLYASKGAGAWMVSGDGLAVPLRVSGIDDTRRMRLAVSRSHRSERIGAVCRRLGIEHEVRSGSVGLKIAMICEQVCDLYIHPSPHTKQWDTCAPEAIISEAGGRMTDLEGRPFTYNRADLYNRLGILASNGSSHDRILEVLRPIWAADH